MKKEAMRQDPEIMDTNYDQDQQREIMNMPLPNEKATHYPQTTCAHYDNANKHLRGHYEVQGQRK